MSISPSYQELESQITALKEQNTHLQNQLRLQQEIQDNFFQAILNSIGDPVFVKDNESRILVVNDAFCEIFGLDRSLILGKTLAEDVRPEEIDLFLKIDREVLETGIENINDETLTIRDAPTKYISTRKTRYINEIGDTFLVGIIRDITERVKNEKNLKENEERLRNLNQTKDKLFSIIAHDLRGPFNTIIGLSTLLVNELNNNPEQKKYAEIMQRTGANTLKLLDNLLYWAKSQSGELAISLKEMNLKSLTSEVIQLLHPVATAKKIDIHLSDADNLKIFSDKEILKTIIRNLVSNAIKFTPENGKITIYLTEKESFVEVSVQDTGIGMSPAQKEILFDISQNKSQLGTAKEKGTGLGLVLCNEFVNKLNGTIDVQSEEGKGSTFTFSIPKNLNLNS